MSLSRIVLTVVIVLLMPVPLRADSGQEGGVGEELVAQLIEQADSLQLSEKQTWQSLLHYRSRLLESGMVSQIDDPVFFLSPDGKTNPRSELNATITFLFSENSSGDPGPHDKCSFIARYHWLKRELAVPDVQGRVLSCPEFDKWYEAMDPESLTFIFASAYMNNPTSMFGHTFLRVDQKGQNESARLVATVVDYVAEVSGDSNPVGVALLGVFGGFKGYFSTMPYYMKVKTYSDIDSRDIWEYRLNLADTQVADVLRHVWELRGIYSDYFYFTENCSYNILSLLEFVYPGLRMPVKFQLRTTPMDVIRLLTEEPGIVKSVTFRPSGTTWIKRMRQTFSSGEDVLFRQVILDSSVMESGDWKALPPERAGVILEAASDYLKHHRLQKKAKLEKDSQRWRELLDARLDLGINSQTMDTRPLTEPPQAGHKTLKISAGYGSRNGEWFEELTLRAGYHDLLDPEPGYPPDAQIEMFSARLRHYQESNRVKLDQFVLLDIVSLVPLDNLFFHPSWKVRAAYESIATDDCRYCGTIVLNFGVGLAGAYKQFSQREVYFAFLEMDANDGRAFDDDYRVGGGISAGVLADLSDSWKVMIKGSYLAYPFGDLGEDVRLSCEQRLMITENTALRMNIKHRKNDDEAVLSFEMYY